MDNGSEALGMPEVKEGTSQKIRNSKSRFFLLLSVMLFLALFLTGAIYINNAIKNQNKNSLMPTSAVVKKSLKIPGYQLVSEGIILNKKANFFTVKENNGAETVIFLDSKTNILLQIVDTVSNSKASNATTSAIKMSKLLSQEKIDYTKIAVNDKVRVNLDEKDSKLIAELIIVFREKK